MKSSKSVFLGVILALVASGLAACSSSNGSNPAGAVTPDEAKAGGPGSAPANGAPILLIRSDYAAGEVTSLCDKAIADATAKIDAIAQVPVAQRTPDNTLLAFENTTAEFGDKTNQLTFMGYVHTNPAINKEGSDCEAKVGAFNVEIFTRRDLYEAVKSVTARNADETRLQDSIVGGYERTV